jgi:hypothetical protein
MSPAVSPRRSVRRAASRSERYPTADSLDEPLGQTADSDNLQRVGGYYGRLMRAYALSEIGDRLAIDVFIRKEDALLALEDALRDEPQSAVMLFVAPIELDESKLSTN